MIAGYAASASIWPGQRLLLHVSTDAARFRVALYRWTGRMMHMLTSHWMDGERSSERAPDQDWQWPQYSVATGAGWPSGVYIAHLQEPEAAPLDIAMQEAAVLFVVRGHGLGALLYKLPLATYNAYNFSGGGCFYANPPRCADPPGAKLTFRRPGGGIGGPTFGAPDHYDASSPRQTFAHWDARFIGWLMRHGYAPEFCTDLDIHADPGLLRNYRLLLSVGHDEYWSVPMRDAVEAYIAHGGNAAFFSANLCWWRVHLVEQGGAMVCHQGGPHGARDHWWPPHGAARPEDALAGVSYRHGGGWWDGPRSAGGFAIQDAGHWIFAGTGLQNGEYVGAGTTPPLVGYECDGAPLAAFDAQSGLATLAPAAPLCGTPPEFHLLAAAPLDARWQERPQREAHAAAGGIHAATMGIIARAGTVFTAGTTDWAQVLGTGQDDRVDRITSNVIEGLLRAGGPRPAPRNIGRAAGTPHSEGIPHMTPQPHSGASWLASQGNARLAVFRALQLGDMLCTVPALRALRAALPHTTIALVGLPWARQFVTRFPQYVDEFIPFPGHAAFPEQPVRHDQLADFYTDMRARRFDVALQMHGSGEQSNKVARAFGARSLAGYGDDPTTHREQFHPYPDAGAEPHRLLDLVHALGAPSAGTELEFPITGADEGELAASGLASDLAPGGYVCIHPGARDREKCWHPARFAQVADQIAREFDVRIVLTGSADEAPLTAEVARRMRYKAIDAASPMSIGAMAALMSRSRLLVCNDTGVSHIAAGLKLNSVVIFSKADIRRWAPLDKQRHRCLWDPRGERVIDVMDHARALLSEQSILT